MASSEAASDPGLQDDAQTTKINEDFATIKCGLRSVIALEDNEYAILSARIEQYIMLVSMMMRRACFVLLHHLLTLAASGSRIPNLYAMNTTYWKNLLKLDVAKGHIPSVDFMPSILATADAVGLVSTVYPVYFDQVVSYAATTLATVVKNNAWVPLIARLKRVTGLIVRSHSEDNETKLTGYELLLRIRSKNPTFDDLPEWAASYAQEVRRRLGMQATEYLHDEFAKKMAFHDVFMFNVWLQGLLKRHDGRRIALSPIIQVDRKHVRLGIKVLTAIARSFLKSNDAITELDDLLKSDDAEKEQGAAGFSNPDKGAHSMLPETIPQLKKSACSSEEEWLAHKSKLAKRNDDVKRIRATDDYKAQKAKYERLVSARASVISSLFRNLPLKAKDGWSFDGSIVTDGVAVSIQFSRERVVVVDNKSDVKKRSPVPRKKANAEFDEDYDRAQTTRIKHKDGRKDDIIAGLDPGRVSLATVAIYVVQDDGKVIKRSWSLGRGQYRQESGIREQDRLKKARMGELEASWEGMGADGASVRTDDVAQLCAYLSKYAEIRDAWWALALRRVESRANLKRYSGKRKVLDAFFAKTRSEIQDLFKGANIHLAYGSAGRKMKPTGKGEVAVPTTGTYKAALRVFKDKLSITDEDRSTMVEWESGKKKEIAYRIVAQDVVKEKMVGEGFEAVRERNVTTYRLGHAVKSVPFVEEGHAAATATFVAKKKAADVARRRCAVAVDKEESAEQLVELRYATPKRDNGRARYPEIRGLRFSPERRIYLDRDREAAITIARLRTVEMLGKLRPAPFHMSFKLA